MPEYQDEQAKMNGELLIMTIEIGNGRKDTIHVFENDNPEDLAKDFCAKHGLSPSIVFPLTQNIYSNMEQVLNERAEILRDYSNPEQFQQENYDSEAPESNIYSRDEPQNYERQEMNKENGIFGQFFSKQENTSAISSNNEKNQRPSLGYKPNNFNTQANILHNSQKENVQTGNQYTGVPQDDYSYGKPYQGRSRTPERNSFASNGRAKTPDMYGKVPDSVADYNYLEDHMNRLFQQHENYANGKLSCV